MKKMKFKKKLFFTLIALIAVGIILFALVPDFRQKDYILEHFPIPAVLVNNSVIFSNEIKELEFNLNLLNADSEKQKIRENSFAKNQLIKFKQIQQLINASGLNIKDKDCKIYENKLRNEVEKTNSQPKENFKNLTQLPCWEDGLRTWFASEQKFNPATHQLASRIMEKISKENFSSYAKLYSSEGNAQIFQGDQGYITERILNEYFVFSNLNLNERLPQLAFSPEGINIVLISDFIADTQDEVKYYRVFNIVLPTNNFTQWFNEQTINYKSINLVKW